MKPLAFILATALSLNAITLDDAIERAMENSPLIHKAQSDLRYANISTKEAQAAYHPTLDAGFNWQDLDKTTTFSFAPTYRYNLSAKYNLFNGFADQALVDARDYESAAQQLLLTAKKSDVKLQVINAYTAYLKAKKSILTQKDQYDSLQRSYDDTFIRYEQGIVAKNELLLIDVQRLRAEQELTAAKSMLVRTRDNLRRTLGGLLEEDERVEDFVAEISTPDAFETLLKRTYESRSELQALYKQRDALESSYHGATGNYYPRVDLSADYIRNDQERYMGTNLIQVEEQIQTTLNVSWNLYNGFSDQSKRQGALEMITAKDIEIAAMKLDLRNQLTEAYQAFLVAQSLKDVAARAKESADENFRITDDRYGYGQVDTLTMLTAQSERTSAHNAYNNAYYDLYTAMMAIERVSGE
jgi:outer membrane protein TolC